VRAFALALTVLFCACGAPAAAPPSSTPVPTREPGNVEVSVLLDLSGARSAIGNAQRNAIQQWLDQNPSRRIRVKFVDLGSSDPRLLLELRRAAIEDRADAVVIGAPLEYSETFARAVAAAALPIILTLPSPDPAQSRWAFGLAPTYADLARLELDDVVGRGLAAPTLLVSDDTPISIAERIAIGREFDRRGLVRPTVVSVTPQDVAQRIRPGASVARSVLLTGAVSSYVDAARSLAGAGITPRTYLSYVNDSSELSGLREAQSMITWPGSRNVVRGGTSSTVAASAYDAVAIIEAAAAGGTERARIRDRIESGVFTGIVSTYTFAPARHAGFRTSDLVYLRWSTAGRPGIAPAPEPSN
jgi:hypothetical protein